MGRQSLNNQKTMVDQCKNKKDLKEKVNVRWKQILYDFNNTSYPYPRDKTVYELFEEQVDTTPENIALVHDRQQMTYRELDQKANQIAHYLINACGGKGENVVAILQEQSIQMITSILGVLKAGYAFLPIDPQLPEQIQKTILDESGAEVMISTKNHICLLNRLQWECRSVKTFVCLDSEDIYHDKEEKTNPLMDKELWDLIGEKSEDSIGRGGWKSSFTGELFTRKEIVEYTDNALFKLKPYIDKKTRILEIGCSSGFTMFRLAPLAGFYYGTDLSGAILEKTKEQVEEEGHLNIRLNRCAAHDIDKLDENDFDIIIFNSVIQTFHGHNYLRQVIQKAVHLLKEKGILFIGDIMDQDTKNDLMTALFKFKKEHKNSGFTTKTDFSDELFLSPEFFNDLVMEQKELVSCSISRKIHTIENELTQYRYDVIIHVNKKNTEVPRRKKTKQQHGLKEIEKCPHSRVLDKVQSHRLAYIIFTSGSTGVPKGVMVEHRALVNMCCWYNHCHAVTAEDRSAKFANCGFDASIMEIFPILLKGGSIHILNPEIKKDLNKLNHYFSDHKITICFLPTQYCEQFMELENHTLRIVNTGGEKLKKYIKRNYTLVDHYGPTECTVVSSYYIVDKQSGNIPIGKPIFNTRIYILDKHDRILPPGETGEICISGDNLARGYLNRPDLTEEKFVKDPFFEGERMYRTGDLARWRADGNIEFLGRLDNQVKIRGYRIELGEIESRLIAHGAVLQTVVTTYVNANKEYGLCAYLVVNNHISTAEIREYLKKQIPEYMIPDCFYILHSMPLTPSGKIDKKALPAPEHLGNHSKTFKAPGNELERKLAKIWKEILAVPRVGIDDNFFEMGGHSLKVLKAAAEVNKEFHVELSALELFNAKTIREQCELIKVREKKNCNSIPRVEKREFYPASSAQKRIYLIQQQDIENTAYNIPFAFLVKGEVHIEKIKSAFYQVTKKHETLRTGFNMVDGNVVQRIKDEPEIHMEYIESAGGNMEQMLQNFIKPFDLHHAPLFRIQLVKIKAREYLLLLDIHHIILDGSSMEVLWDELSKAYHGEELGSLPVQYKDFSKWQQQELAEGVLRKQGNYWLKQWSGEIPVLKLPLDYERPGLRNFEGDVYHFEINRELTKKLHKLSQSFDASLNMLLLAAYKIMLSKYSSIEDIVVGTPVYGRRHADLKNVIGMFVNTLALRSYPEGGKKFKDYQEEVKQVILQGLEHQDFPFEELVEMVDGIQDRSRKPLFDTMFVMQKFSDENLKLRGLEIQRLNPKQTKTKFDLTWFGSSHENTLQFTVEYASKLFARDTIRRMARHYQRIIEQITSNPWMLISQIELITHEEKRIILNDFNYSRKYPNQDQPVHQMFEEVVKRNGKEPALVFNNRTMCYEELNKRANQVAAHLRKKRVGRESIVALVACRSFEMMIGILGILKAGAALLPLSPEYPEKYIDEILESSKVKMVLKHFNDQGLEQDLERVKCEVIDINDKAILLEEDSNLESVNTPSDLLYIIYTSGTTGKPKGVMIENRNFINLIYYERNETQIDFDSVLQFASITFDVSFQEIFSCLLFGGKLLLISEPDRTDILKLFGLIQKENLKTLFLPPAFLELIFSEERYREHFPTCVKHIVSAGEQLYISESFKEYIKENSVFVHNHYGPSETHVVTALTLDPTETIPDKPSIGKPIANRTIYIMDKDGKLLPSGVAGELYISGEDIGRGYLNQPELTEEKFLKDPFIKGQKLYRSGDRARWLSDGSIEFLGRADEQIKIRGYRIETAGIERVLMNYGKIKKVFVTSFEVKGDKYLCAYIISDSALNPRALKTYLSRRLPSYMVPAYYVFIQDFPLNSHGKVDRKALPLPDIMENRYNTEQHNPPMDDIERKLAEIWQEIFAVPSVGRDDNFFELGGHSLKVLKAAVEIHKIFHVELSAAELFKAKTIKEQSKLIKERENKNCSPIPRVEKREFYPASPAQKRIYAIQQMYVESTAYNMPFLFLIKGEVGKERLKSAFRQVIKKHEVLRTGFDIVDGNVVQRIKDEPKFHMEYIESTGVDTEELLQNFIKPFDLRHAPLFRLQLVKMKAGEYLFLLDIHHILLDGSSIEILWDELSKAYHGEDLGTLPVQYKDFSKWQQKQLAEGRLGKQSEYWIKQLSGKIPVLKLPLDFERPAIRSFEGDLYHFGINRELTKKLHELSQKYDVSLNMLLLAAYKIMLSKYSSQEDIVVGTPVYGRNHADLKNVIGMFVNTLALRSYPKGNKKFRNYLEEIKQVILQGLEHQDFPFEELVEKVDGFHDVSRNPLFDTMFVMQNFSEENLKLNGLVIQSMNPGLRNAKFDLTWFVELKEDTLQFTVEYASKLFTRDTVMRSARHYERILYQISSNPLVHISQIEMIRNEENRLISDDFNHSRNCSEHPSVFPMYKETVHEGAYLPISSIEEKLVPIWQEVLEKDRINIEDDFFELGGHSLKAIKLMHRVKIAFNKDLPVSVLLKHSTIKKLALLLDSNLTDGRWSHVVEISRNDNKNIIFCIHPAPGTVICYYDLAKYFKEEWSIYALQAKGLEKGHIPHATVEEMAGDYIKAIKEIQPKGPYIFIGWSVGGHIGYEIAQQLSKLGDEVKLLAMLDTDPWFGRKVKTKPIALPLYLYGITAMLKHCKIAYKNFNITSFGLKALYRRLKMWVSIARAVIRYQPVCYNGNGRIVLFQTDEGAKIERKIKDKSQSVRSFIGGLEVVPLGGKHVTMFNEPDIQNLCVNLKLYLDEYV